MRIRPIRASLMWTFAAFVLLALGLLGSVSLYFFKATLLETARDNSTSLAKELARVIENYVVYMDDIALVVMNDEGVRSYLADPARSEAATKRRVSAFLSSIRSVRKDIDGIFLVPGPTAAAEGGAGRIDASLVVASAPGGGVNRDFDFGARLGELQSRARPGSGPIVSASRVESLVDGRYPWVVSLLRRVPGGAGWIQVDLNYAIIEDLCRDIQLGKSGYVFIVDATGDIVYHPRQQLVYGGLRTERIPEILALHGGSLSVRVDGRDVLYSAVGTQRTGWTVVAVSRIDELFAGANRAEYTFIMLAIACFAVSVLASSLVSTRISRPIESLRRSMQAVESGNFDIDITVNCRNEVWELARDCDIAVKKVRDLIEENSRDAEQKRLLELRALQAQINPHFLYNTLDSIIWMMELGETGKAIDVTSALAKFFRLGINRGSEVIAIRTEAEYLETYLSIQKTRYEKRLDYEISFDPAIQGLRILKLLVQPIVENAIYHGIKNKEGPGLVRVMGRLEGNVVVIRVDDDGVGMSEAQLAELRRSLAEGASAGTRPAGEGGEKRERPAPVLDVAHSFGVGALNVQDRIRLYFGPDYGLSYESRAGLGTTATLRIPVMPAEVAS